MTVESYSTFSNFHAILKLRIPAPDQKVEISQSLDQAGCKVYRCLFDITSETLDSYLKTESIKTLNWKWLQPFYIKIEPAPTPARDSPRKITQLFRNWVVRRGRRVDCRHLDFKCSNCLLGERDCHLVWSSAANISCSVIASKYRVFGSICLIALTSALGNYYNLSQISLPSWL